MDDIRITLTLAILATLAVLATAAPTAAEHLPLRSDFAFQPGRNRI